MKRFSQKGGYLLIQATVFCIAIGGTFFFAARAELPSTPTASSWGTDGAVSVIKTTPGGITYIGGSFSHIGRTTGPGVILDAVTGNPAPSFPSFPSGYTIAAVTSDGSGGWFVGGYFNGVDGTSCQNLIHILSSGTVDPAFCPNPDSEVNALALSGTTLYAGGTFTTVNGGTTRRRAAAFDVATGLATAFDPDLLDGGVQAILMSGSEVYLGGNFIHVRNFGTARPGLARFDSITGDLSISSFFHPNIQIGTYVNALAISGTTIYAGGSFTQVNGGLGRRYLAAFDTSTGTATSFNPNLFNGFVNALVLDGTTLYAGGGFTSVNGAVPRHGIAAFDTTTLTGTVTSFDPDLGSGGQVYAMALDGTTLYLGGDISSVNVATIPAIRGNFASVDVGTGVATAFNPSMNAVVHAIAVNGTMLFAGGDFMLINSVMRHNLGSINTLTDTVTSFDPDVDSDVISLDIVGTTLYAGGYFSSVNNDTNGIGQTPTARQQFAAFDTTSPLSAVTDFDPGMNGSVNALATNGTTLYAGGSFTGANQQSQANYAVVTDLTGSLQPALPTVDGSVTVSIPDGSGGWYIGGDFLSVDGDTDYAYLAHITSGGALDAAFAPAVFDDSVYALLLDGTTLYVGGAFSSYLVALDSATGAAIPVFAPSGIDNTVRALAVDASTVYAGGILTGGLKAFDKTNGSDVVAFAPVGIHAVGILILDGTTLYVSAGTPNLTALNTSDGSVVPGFSPAANGSIFAMVLSGSTLYVGDGSLARMHAYSAVDGSDILGFTGPHIGNAFFYALAIQGTTLFAGVNDLGSGHVGTLYALDAATGNPKPFALTMTKGQPRTMSVAGNRLLVGGTPWTGIPTFSSYVTRNYLAAFDLTSSSSFVTSFDPDLDDGVQSLALSGTTLYAGGFFGHVNNNTNGGGQTSVTRNYLAAFDTTSPLSVATSFDPDLNSSVHTLLFEGTTLYVGGEFDSVNNDSNSIGQSPVTRNRIAAFDTTSPLSVATSFDPDVDNFVYALALDGTSLYAGGDFSSVNSNTNGGGQTSVTRNYLAAFDTTSPLSVATSFDPDVDGSVAALSFGSARLIAGGAFGSVNTNISRISRSNFVLFGSEATPTPTPHHGATGSYVRLASPTPTVSSTPAPSLSSSPTSSPIESQVPVSPSPRPSRMPTPPLTPTETALVSPSSVETERPSEISDGVAPIPGSPTTGGIEQVVRRIATYVPTIADVATTVLAIAMASSITIASFVAGSLSAVVSSQISMMIASFGLRRRRRVWGVVYDARTKAPIAYAKVELRDASQRVLETRYTNQSGQYGFLISPASLQQSSMQVAMIPIARGYSFPSVTVTGETDFIVYDHVYHGGLVTVTGEMLANFNIPMEPSEQIGARISRPFVSNVLAYVLDVAFWVGLIAAPLNVYLHPSVASIALLVLFVGANAVRITSNIYRPFGTIRDAAQGKSLAYALVTLTDATGKRIAYAVSDDRGRYALSVDRGAYSLTAYTPANVLPQRTSAVSSITTKGWVRTDVAV